MEQLQKIEEEVRLEAKKVAKILEDFHSNTDTSRGIDLSGLGQSTCECWGHVWPRERKVQFTYNDASVCKEIRHKKRKET